MTLPADLAVFGTGHVTSTTRLSTGEQLVVIETPPVRDLSLVLLPAEGIDVVTREIRGRVVRLVIPPTGYPSALVDTVMDTAARVLPLYATWLGELPGAELDLVPVDLDGFGGIAWSDTIWLDLSRQAATDLDTASRTDLQFVVAHELAHQWVPIAIGSNNNRHNFMSESLASHLAVLALASSSDQPVAAWLEDHVVTPYRALLERGEDGIVDDPVSSTVATSERAALIYGKGVLGFEAIRQTIGTDAYLAALAQYADAFRFGISTPSDLRHAFESTSGQHLTDLWHEWFNAAVTTPADIDAILTTAPTIPLPATPNYPVTLSDDAVLSGARQFAPYAERELQAARRPRHPRHPPLSRLLPNPRHSERSSAAGRSLASRTNPSP